MSPRSPRYFSILCLLFFAVTAVMAEQGALTWSELTAEEFRPRRDHQETVRYQSRVAEIRASGQPLERVILKEVFQMDESEIIRCLARQCPQQYRLVINSYPYWLENNTGHLLLYSNYDNWDYDELNQQSEKLLAELLPALKIDNRFNYVIRMNINKNRTVKGLAHTHIFIRSDDGREALTGLIKNIEFSSRERIPLVLIDNRDGRAQKINTLKQRPIKTAF